MRQTVGTKQAREVSCGAARMTAVKSMFPDAISRWEVDFAVVNGENSAGTGFGITEDT
jgi:calcineurin-like phosphoesterase